jgi:hypothetical protein
MLSILQNNIQFKGKHVSTKFNTIADFNQELPKKQQNSHAVYKRPFLRLFSRDRADLGGGETGVLSRKI